MKNIILSTLGLLMLALPTASSAQNDKQNENRDMKTDKKVLVVFFSHTGENYGVGNITKGNTCIVAEMIAEATGGELFEIVPVQKYPKTYDACVDLAKKEKSAGARPAIEGDIAVEEYDTVFIGYPNWWGDMPMPVYTFIERHDWQGKNVIPFCTHEGSGLSNTEKYIAEACKDATVGKSLAMRGTTAQNSREQAKKSVLAWFERAGF